MSRNPANVPIAFDPPPTQATTQIRIGAAEDRAALRARLVADDALELAHHPRVRVRPDDRTDAVVRGLDRRDPVAQRLVDRVLERRAARLDGDDLRAEQLHPPDVERLALDVDRAHEHHAVEPEQRGRGRRRHAVLARARLGDDAPLVHLAGQQRLPEHVVDLVRAGVGEVLALEEHPHTEPVGEPGALGDRGRAARVAREQLRELGPELVRRPRGPEVALELLEGRDERLGDEAAAEVARSGRGRSARGRVGRVGRASPRAGTGIRRLRWGRKRPMIRGKPRRPTVVPALARFSACCSGSRPDRGENEREARRLLSCGGGRRSASRRGRSALRSPGVQPSASSSSPAARAASMKRRSLRGSLRPDPAKVSTPLETSTPQGRIRRIASPTLWGSRPPASSRRIPPGTPSASDQSKTRPEPGSGESTSTASAGPLATAATASSPATNAWITNGTLRRIARTSDSGSRPCSWAPAQADRVDRSRRPAPGARRGTPRSSSFPEAAAGRCRAPRSRSPDGGFRRTNTNPRASAPRATASRASSSFVIPQIFTNTRTTVPDGPGCGNTITLGASPAGRTRSGTGSAQDEVRRDTPETLEGNETCETPRTGPRGRVG